MSSSGLISICSEFKATTSRRQVTAKQTQKRQDLTPCPDASSSLPDVTAPKIRSQDVNGSEGDTVDPINLHHPKAQRMARPDSSRQNS